MASAGDLIINALLNLGVGSPGETLDANSMATGFRVLNNMLASWGTESLMVYSIQPTVFQYIVGPPPYTQGPGGQFNAPRFNKIELAYSRDVQGNDYPIDVTEDYQEYASLVAKQTTTTLPQMLYVNYGFPYNEIYIWPVPSANTYSLVLWTWLPLQSFATTADTVVLPPGYEPAIEYNLAVELGPKFGRSVPPEIINLAIKYRAQIKRINHFSQEMQMPMRLQGDGYNYYDFIAGR